MTPGRLVFWWLVARAVVWAGALRATMPSQPLDVLEHLAWAREWRAVYEHHPGAPAWINGLLDRVGGGDSFLLSLPSPVCASLAMAAVWLLARRVVDEKRAAIAVLSLEGVYYFNVAAVEFNHNVLQTAAWAWVVYAAHRAFFPGGGGEEKVGFGFGLGRWAALGALCAFSLYAKYSSALLLAVLFFWSVAEPRARLCYRGGGVWIAFALFALLTLPQGYALFALDFSPFRFALSRAKEAESFLHHAVYPMRFLAAQCAALLLAAILCGAALINKKARRDRQPTTDNRQPTTDNRQPTTDNRQPTTDNRPLLCFDGCFCPFAAGALYFRSRRLAL